MAVRVNDACTTYCKISFLLSHERTALCYRAMLMLSHIVLNRKKVVIESTVLRQQGMYDSLRR